MATISKEREARRWTHDATRWVSHHSERLALLGACLSVLIFSLVMWVAKSKHPTTDDLLPWVMLLAIAMFTKTLADSVKNREETLRTHREHDALKRDIAKLRNDLRKDIRGAQRVCDTRLKLDARKIERRIEALEAGVSDLAQSVETAVAAQPRRWFQQAGRRRA